MITSECNLACDYCYIQKDKAQVLSLTNGRNAIDRALASTSQNGLLELGFFGGEPLLRTERLLELLDYAGYQAKKKSVQLDTFLTTNGTVADDNAWEVLTDERIRISVSCDGTKAVHDRHRCRKNGGGSFDATINTIQRLLDVREDLTVASVVCPDTVGSLRQGIEELRELGVRKFAPSLDLWAKWKPHHIDLLEQTCLQLGEYWADHFPETGISWYDEKVVKLASLPVTDCSRCAFGDGQIAVSPSGHLYPCERLIAGDTADNPNRLPGHVNDGQDFMMGTTFPAGPNCSECVLVSFCNTACRCSNFARTNQYDKPDELLCRWNKACMQVVGENLVTEEERGVTNEIS